MAAPDQLSSPLHPDVHDLAGIQWSTSGGLYWSLVTYAQDQAVPTGGKEVNAAPSPRLLLSLSIFYFENFLLVHYSYI